MKLAAMKKPPTPLNLSVSDYLEVLNNKSRDDGELSEAKIRIADEFLKSESLPTGDLIAERDFQRTCTACAAYVGLGDQT